MSRKTHLLCPPRDYVPGEAEALTEILGRDVTRSSRCGTGEDRAVSLAEFSELAPEKRCSRCDLMAMSPGIKVESPGPVSVVTRSFVEDATPRPAGDLDLRSLGCGDSSCMFGRPGGMATNGGCRCFCRHRSDPREDRRKAEALLAEVKRLRADREKAREALGAAERVCGPCARKLAPVRAALAEPPAGGEA